MIPFLGAISVAKVGDQKTKLRVSGFANQYV